MGEMRGGVAKSLIVKIFTPLSLPLMFCAYQQETENKTESLKARKSVFFLAF